MSQTSQCGCQHEGGEATSGACAVPPVVTIGPAGPAGPVRADETVAAIAQRVPGALPVLQRFGIDTCCGGGLTLAQAAVSAGVPVEAVLAALAGDGDRR